MSEEQLEQQAQQADQQQQPVKPDAAAEAAAEERAMEAAFNAQRGIAEEKSGMPPAKAPGQPDRGAKPDAASETQDATGGEEPPPEPEPKVFGDYTAADLTALVEKAKQVDTLVPQMRKAFNKIGELQATLRKLQVPAPQEPPAAAAGPKFEKLRAEYPSVAEALIPDLEALTSSPKGIGQPEVEAIVAKASEAMSEQAQQDILGIFRPNWQTEVVQPEFLTWLRGQPEDYRAEVLESPKASTVLKTIADFEAHAKQAKAAANKEAAVKKQQRRLEAAAPPPSGGEPAQGGMTEEQAMIAGFQRVRGTALR